MTTAAQALAGLAPQGQATQLAPMAQAQEPNPFMALMSDPKIFMALMGGGLSTLGSGNVGQGFQTGMGTYQQLLQNEQSEAAGVKEDERFQQQMGLEERRVAASEEGLELERERNEIARKAAIAKAKQVEKKPPTGVDNDLWKQALDTAVAETGLEGTVSEARVRTIYNTMAPQDRQVPEMFGKNQLTDVMGLIDKNPEMEAEYLQLTEDMYGASARKRLEAVRKKMGQATAEADADAGDDEGVPESIKRIVTSAAEVGMPASPIAPVFNPMQAMGTVKNYFQPENLYNNYPFTTLGK